MGKLTQGQPGVLEIVPIVQIGSELNCLRPCSVLYLKIFHERIITTYNQKLFFLMEARKIQESGYPTYLSHKYQSWDEALFEVHLYLEPRLSETESAFASNLSVCITLRNRSSFNTQHGNLRINSKRHGFRYNINESLKGTLISTHRV